MGVDIKLEQYNEGLVKHHSKCTNHKSMSILLTVPQYSDLLNNQGDEDEDECGCLLVDTAEGWQTEMVKWIAASRAADAAEGIEDAVEVVVVATTQCPPWLVPAEIKAEAALMQALAELEEDEWLDDGEVEIASEDEYME